jgi:hypothetical protein
MNGCGLSVTKIALVAVSEVICRYFTCSGTYTVSSGPSRNKQIYGSDRGLLGQILAIVVAMGTLPDAFV